MVTVVFRLESTSMKKLSVFGAFRFSEFRIRDCVPVLPTYPPNQTSIQLYCYEPVSVHLFIWPHIYHPTNHSSIHHSSSLFVFIYSSIYRSSYLFTRSSSFLFFVYLFLSIHLCSFVCLFVYLLAFIFFLPFCFFLSVSSFFTVFLSNSYISLGLARDKTTKFGVRGKFWRPIRW
jgi:hypothetical protein